MKVLTTPEGTILTLGISVFTGEGGDHLKGSLLGLDGVASVEKGQVAERPDAEVKRLVTAATKLPAYQYMETKDFMRDIRYLNKSLADVADGTEVGVIGTARGVRLDIPKDARPDYTDGLKVGSQIAVGPNISPKALMNARGKVTAIRGNRATVDFEPADIDRVKRSTGKAFGTTTTVPTSCCEVIA